jgi:hypothetical protein
MFDFFKIEKNRRLFSQQYLEKLINFAKPHIEYCESDKVVPLDIITLDVLEERKLCIPFKKWRTIQSSKFPVVQNVFWHICSTTKIAHHEIRDGINEVNENLIAQGNVLDCFIFTEQNGSYCCFWLYTRKINEERFFNATVMILPGIGDLFGFDINGNSVHK